jgi:hypothetical protein
MQGAETYIAPFAHGSISPVYLIILPDVAITDFPIF